MFKKRNTAAVRTERLTLIPLAARHAKEMLKLWRDPDIVRYMNLEAPAWRGECRVRIKRLLQANVGGGCPNHFVLALGQEVIGLAGFPLDKKEGPSFGLYYLLSKKYWGCGYALEASGAVLSYLFEHYPKAVVHADSVADNRASVAILKKLGFQQTKKDEGAFTKNGDKQDILHFTLQANADSPANHSGIILDK